jgi:hypothetical protein
VYKGRILELCLAQKYPPIDRQQQTGLETVQPMIEQNYNIMSICYCSQIDRGISIVPDFKLGQQNGNNFYRQYLVNIDTDRYSFINSKGSLQTLPANDYIDWSLNISLNEQSTNNDE